MSATAVAHPVSLRPTWTRTATLVLLAVVAVTLLALTFVLGRTSVEPAGGSRVIAPGAGVSTAGFACQVNRPC